MIDLMKKLVETDFEDQFKPVSDEDYQKRVEKVLASGDAEEIADFGGDLMGDLSLESRRKLFFTWSKNDKSVDSLIYEWLLGLTESGTLDGARGVDFVRDCQALKKKERKG